LPPATLPKHCRKVSVACRGIKLLSGNGKPEGDQCQLTCKPGSVGPRCRDVVTIHLRRLLPARSCNQPGRHGLETGWVSPRHPYLVLLPVGFTVRPLSPDARCALTAPFHPYRSEERRFAFCGTFPGVAPGGVSPSPCFDGARTFLQQAVTHLPAVTRSTGAAYVREEAVAVKSAAAVHAAW
jgi:hypothetical protein